MQDKAGQTVAVVYETVIVPRDNMPPLFVATVSEDEALDPKEELGRFLWRAFRTPETAVMSFEDWSRISKAIENRGIWEELEHDVVFYWMRHLSSKLWEGWTKEVRRVRSAINQCLDRGAFATSSIRGVFSQSVIGGMPVMPWRRRPAIGITFPILGAYESPLAAMYVVASLRLQDLDITVDQLGSWVSATDILTRRVPVRLERSMEAVLECDIPYSMSPQSGSGPLSRFAHEARFVALFPIGAVTLPATNLVVQGNYVTAIEVALGGAGVSLVLAATFSLVDFILNLPRKRKQ